MIEIRAARSEELDEMLEVMCEAFELPFSAARDIFYRDPYFDIENKRVLLEDDILASCLTFVEAPLWIGGAAVRVGGVAGVATRASHRGRGLAGKLLTDSLFALRAKNYALSALFPFRPDYYRRFGWETSGTQYEATLTPSSLPPFSEGRYVRAALPADRSEIATLYAARSEHKTGRWLRDDRRWSYLWEHVSGKAIFKRERVEGYLFYEVRETEPKSSRLRIVEMVSTSERAQRGLVSYLAQQRGCQEISYTASWSVLEESGLLAAGPTGQSECQTLVRQKQGVMFRVLDFAAALNALKPNFAGYECEVTLVLKDPQAVTGSVQTAVTILGDGENVEIRPETADQRFQRRIEGDVAAWSPVLAGYHSLEDALALNRLRASTEKAAEIAAPLFPRRDPFIPSADHF
jgi:predicted acetyltransferase